MKAKGRRCRGTNAAGDPCRSPVVGADGWCAAHRPGGAAEMRRRGLRGALASRSGKGLDTSDLPPLTSPQAAERWAETIARAVAERRLTHNEGRAIASLLREWRASHEAGAMSDRIAELSEKLEALEGPRRPKVVR